MSHPYDLNADEDTPDATTDYNRQQSAGSGNNSNGNLLPLVPTTSAGSGMIGDSVNLSLSFVVGTPDSVDYVLQDIAGNTIETIGTSFVNPLFPVAWTVGALALGMYRIVAVATDGLLQITSSAIIFTVTSLL